MNTIHQGSEGAGGVVQHVAVQLTETNNKLERVTQRVREDDAVDTQEGQGPPEDGGDGLHGDDEGVLSEVARVGEGVLLPQLAEEVEAGGHAVEVVGEVALEEEVDAAAEGEPQGGEDVTAGEAGPDAGDDGQGGGEDGSAAGGEVGDEHGRGDGVGCVAGHGDAQGEVGVSPVKGGSS